MKLTLDVENTVTKRDGKNGRFDRAQAVIIGFSQGGAMTLASALRTGGAIRPAAMACLSGMLTELDGLPDKGELFIIGGAQLFAETLPVCSELFLTHVKGDYPGDTFLPPFEQLFTPVETLRESDEIQVVRYRNKALLPDSAY